MEQHIITALFKMLSFGFDTCIKTNSPFVIRLISDTLLDTKTIGKKSHLIA